MQYAKLTKEDSCYLLIFIFLSQVYLLTSWTIQTNNKFILKSFFLRGSVGSLDDAQKLSHKPNSIKALLIQCPYCSYRDGNGYMKSRWDDFLPEVICMGKGCFPSIETFSGKFGGGQRGILLSFLKGISSLPLKTRAESILGC